MDNNNINTQIEETTQQGQKTFSQDDVNRIVQDRLAKERAKSSEEMNKKEQELADREFRLNSRQKLIERGYPETLLDALNCNSEEAFNKALDALDSLMKDKGVTPEQQELEKKRARFTVPLNVGGLRAAGPDPIRKAMGLN